MTCMTARRKTKDERRKTKDERRKTKDERRKTKDERRVTLTCQKLILHDARKTEELLYHHWHHFPEAHVDQGMGVYWQINLVD